MEAVGHGLPVARQFHHVSRIEHAVAEQVVELEAGAVDRPVVLVVRVVQVVPLRREHRQMLHVTPRQARAARAETGRDQKLLHSK